MGCKVAKYVMGSVASVPVAVSGARAGGPSAGALMAGEVPGSGCWGGVVGAPCEAFAWRPCSSLAVEPAAA